MPPFWDGIFYCIYANHLADARRNQFVLTAIILIKECRPKADGTPKLLGSSPQHIRTNVRRREFVQLHIARGFTQKVVHLVTGRGSDLTRSGIDFPVTRHNASVSPFFFHSACREGACQSQCNEGNREGKF